MGWSISDIEQLQKSGKIKGYKASGRKKGKNTSTLPPALKSPKTPKGVWFIRLQLEQSGLKFEKEYFFAKPRLYRFDFAIPHRKIYIEYEGLVAPGRMGGHQSTAGYTDNTNKYNLAATLGWTGYRYTSRNYQNFERDLKAIINGLR